MFNGTAGQTAVLRASGITTNVSPFLELYDPDGILINSASSFSNNAIITQSLTKTGVYTVLVSANQDGDTGNYTLSLGNIRVNLLSPNGGEVLLAGSPVTITWSSTANNPSLASHDLYLSTDGGFVFSVIASGLSSFAQSYTWNIPANLATNNGRILVIARDSAGNACQDTSDANFTVATFQPTTSVTYTYDELNRLTLATYADGTRISYTYDEVGNRKTEALLTESSLLDETFSGGIPSTWTVVNGGSGGGSAATWTTANPCSRSIGSPFGSSFVIIDSDCAGSSATQDEQLITPTINASGCNQVMLEFSNQFHWYSGGLNEIADVDVSTNGGSTWINVLRMQGTDDGYPTPNTKAIDITSAIAANPSNVKIRFHYYNASFEWWWAIDNVKIKCLAPGASFLRIDSVIPAAGRASGGQQIRLAGAFANLSSVTVGGVSASWTYSNGTSEITVTTPSHAVGAVNIDLTPTSGIGYSKTNAFAYLPTTFTDNTLVVGVTTVKAQHIIELRQAVDALRAVAGLGPAPWADATLVPFNTAIKAVHITELRSYLENVAALLGYSAGSYTDPGLSSGFVIKRVHIEELRQRIRTIAG